MECSIINDSSILCNDTVYERHTPSIPWHHGSNLIPPGTTAFWCYVGIYIALVCFAGLCSGLTLGLLSLDTTTLVVLAKSGTEKQKKEAEGLLPLVKRHHLLLVTLLLCNAIAVEAMPVFLNKVSGEVFAIVVSVTLVLLFGEVIPQAVCSRYGTSIGYYSIPLVYAMIALTFVISFPISKLLDCLLGKNHATYYKRSELGALVDILADDDCRENVDRLTSDEKLIIKGALMLTDKKVKDVSYTKIKDVFMLDILETFSTRNIKQIQMVGRSRIPIYAGERTNIVGMVLVKDLIGYDSQKEITFKEILNSCGRKMLRYDWNKPMYELLNEFQEGKSHMALVTKMANGGRTNNPTEYIEEVVGIITLEDILEEILQEPIYDETDQLGQFYKLLSSASATGTSGLQSIKDTIGRARSFTVDSPLFRKRRLGELPMGSPVSTRDDEEPTPDSERMPPALTVRRPSDSERQPLLGSSKTIRTKFRSLNQSSQQTTLETVESQEAI